MMRFSQLVPSKHQSVGRGFQGTRWEHRVMYGGLYQHMRVVFYYTPNLIELCDMRYVIWTAVSHGHIK